MMALAVFFCGVATGLAQDNPPIRSKEIKLSQVEEQPMFQTRNVFMQITATYLESTPTRVKLKLPRGDVQEIPMFYFGSPPIHYFLNKMAKIPETVTDHRISDVVRCQGIFFDRQQDLAIGQGRQFTFMPFRFCQFIFLDPQALHCVVSILFGISVQHRRSHPDGKSICQKPSAC